MKGFSKKFAAVAMVAGLALSAAACEAEGDTTDPAQEAPAGDDLGGDTGDDLGGDTGGDTGGELGGTETETETTP